MARQKADNFDQIKAGIIDAAAEVFAEKGFRNASIIDVGHACKASKSRLYHYFASKEAMLFEMLHDHVGGLVEQARRAFSQKAPIEERFALFIQIHIDYYLQHAAKHSVLLHDIDYLSAQQQSLVTAGEKQLLEMMVGLIRQLDPKRFESQPAAKTHAMLIYGMLNWTYTWYDAKGAISPQTLAQDVTRLCLRGLKGS